MGHHLDGHSALIGSRSRLLLPFQAIRGWLAAVGGSSAVSIAQAHQIPLDELVGSPDSGDARIHVRAAPSRKSADG